MRGLNRREKILLGFCFLVIFVVANVIAWNYVKKMFIGSDSKGTLQAQIADNEMWLEEAPKWAIRDKWIIENIPPMGDESLGKKQGDLLEQLQTDLFDRKLKIESQSLTEPAREVHYTEVAVRLRIRGDADVVTDWLSTLQGPDKFQVIKAIELELDKKSKEETPQAVCQITIARWFAPTNFESTARFPKPHTETQLAGVIPSPTNQ